MDNILDKPEFNYTDPVKWFKIKEKFWFVELLNLKFF